MKVEEKRLDEVCSLITDGKHGDCNNQENSGYFFISAKDVFNWKINYSNARQITKADFEDTHRRTKLEPDDVVMVSTGASIGRLAIVKESPETSRTTFQKSVAILKPIKSLISPKYLAYFLKNSNDLMHAVSSGSAQKNVLLKDLRSFKIPYYCIDSQKKIANILGAYDDLIENNLMRIKLLEEATQNIYNEWFVNFRFPNYEHTDFEDVSGLPVGWCELSVKEYCDIVSKGSSLNYMGDEALIPVLNQSCVRNGELELEKIRYACPLKEAKEYCYLKLNDILINSMGDGTLGRVSKNNTIENKYIIHNCITFLRAKTNYSQPLLYGFISSKQDYFITVAHGSTGQSTLNLKLINELKLNVPTKIIIDAFDKIILPMWQTIGTLKKTNQNLKEARDILLPRLMNRTIEV